MKIIHTSDIHLDSALTTHLSSDKVRERKRELISSFRKTVEQAERAGAVAYIIAGDLFDTEKVSRSTVETLMRTIENTPSITFFYLFGNHEKRLIIDSGIPLPRNLKIFEDDWTYYRIENTIIAGRCATTEGMFDTLNIDEDKRNIVILHGELADKSAPGGYIGAKEIEDKPIDYLALGHYHSYSAKRISQRCTAVYSGTPEPRGFDEVGVKGVVEIECDLYSLTHRFVPCAKRAAVILEADITDAKNLFDIENILNNVTRGVDSGDIVRIILKGEREVSFTVDTERLASKFDTRFYYCEVKDRTHARIDPEDYKHDKSLKGEFIRCVLSADISEEEKANIIATGLSALLGESID